tara:strand:+ start:12274 stop:13176 length:903 start_codon:yes stop_codon:yes gene_type:complete
MATSGSTNFELDVADYIEEAFERCGLEARTGYDLKTARRSLNLVFADWANRGLNRWTIRTTTIPLATGVGTYPAGILTLSVAASANFTLGETITGGTSGATASVTSLPSTTSIAITVPTGTFQSGETITGATSGTATTSTAVVDFSDVNATIDLLSAVIRTDAGTSNQSDITLGRVSRDQYLTTPSKLEQAEPSQFYVNRQITPLIELWPVPDDVQSYSIVFDRLFRIQDADSQVETVEVPFRFYPCLAAGLAYYMALKRAPDRVGLLKQVYEEEFDRAATEDRDRANLNLTPTRDFYYI